MTTSMAQTTPSPKYTHNGLTVEGAPVPMGHPEKARLRAAAFRVTRLYPGPVGELLSREILTWEEFGYRLSNSVTTALIARLVEHIMNEPLPS